MLNHFRNYSLRLLTDNGPDRNGKDILHVLETQAGEYREEQFDAINYPLAPVFKGVA